MKRRTLFVYLTLLAVVPMVFAVAPDDAQADGHLGPGARQGRAALRALLQGQRLRGDDHFGEADSDFGSRTPIRWSGSGPSSARIPTARCTRSRSTRGCWTRPARRSRSTSKHVHARRGLQRLSLQGGPQGEGLRVEGHQVASASSPTGRAEPQTLTDARVRSGAASRPSFWPSARRCSSSRASGRRTATPGSSRSRPRSSRRVVLVATYRRFPLTPLAYRLIFLHAVHPDARRPLHVRRGAARLLGARPLRPRAQPLRPPRPLRAGLRAGDRRPRDPAPEDAAEARRLAVLSRRPASASRSRPSTSSSSGGRRSPPARRPTAFLGTQGDVWDTQWDMFLCLAGRAHGAAHAVPRPRPASSRGSPA